MAGSVHTGLRVRLMLLVLLAILPALGLAVYSAWGQRREAGTRVQTNARQLTVIAAAGHERLVEGARQLLTSLARLPEVRTDNHEECNALFLDIEKQYRAYANLGAIDLSGNPFCSALPLPDHVNLADRLYFRRAIETRGFAVGEYQVGRITGKPTVNFGMPVFDEEGGVRAVVFAALDLAWLNELASNAGLPATSTLTLIDHSGVVLARYPDPERWLGKPAPESSIVRTVLAEGEGVAEAPGPDGSPALFGFTRLHSASESGAVYLFIGIPKRTAYAEVDRALKNHLVGLGIVAIVVMLAAWLFADRFILRPVDSLVGTARLLATGDLDTRSTIPYERGELGQLARAFDDMARALQAHALDLERQREALYRSERMAALGRLAAGIAHDLRNSLSVTEARVRFLRKELAAPVPNPEMLREHAAKLQEAGQRMRQIMEGLSTYSKPPKPEPTSLDVGVLLHATREMIGHEARDHNVEVVVEAEPALPKILADRSQLMQVLVNLATNAIEAMAETGGRLGLRASARGRGPDQLLAIEVSDTGPGIPRETLSKMWEAFYTTKAEGTGLGLSIVRALMALQRGANIDVRTEAEEGTTFTLTFPAERMD
jgi:signal transduction histidine kinase